MAVELTPSDLAPFATIEEVKANAMIADALAMARLAAPCIDNADFAHGDAVKAILRGAILRWNEAGAGGRTQVTDHIGPLQFSEAYQAPTRRTLFWPSEIDQLKKLCVANGGGKAWSYDTAPGCAVQHADTCSLVFGAAFCSCGADIAGFSLYGSDGD